MIFLYLMFGFLALVAAGSSPADPLGEIQADKSRPARRGELATAVAVWCIAVAVWPLAVVVRGARALAVEMRRHRR